MEAKEAPQAHLPPHTHIYIHTSIREKEKIIYVYIYMYSCMWLLLLLLFEGATGARVGRQPRSEKEFNQSWWMRSRLVHDSKHVHKLERWGRVGDSASMELQLLLEGMGVNWIPSWNWNCITATASTLPLSYSHHPTAMVKLFCHGSQWQQLPRQRDVDYPWAPRSNDLESGFFCYSSS